MPPEVKKTLNVLVIENNPVDCKIILEMLARSASRTDVAARLGCSTSTVDRRLALLRQKLGVATTIQVIVAAVRRDLI